MPYYLFLIILMSIITYGLYALDKYRSVKGKWRIKERTLLWSSFAFGAVGGLLAMYQFRHKTKHSFFIFINWFGLMIHLGLAYVLHLNQLLFL